MNFNRFLNNKGIPILDISQDTAEKEDIALGVAAYNKYGERIIGRNEEILMRSNDISKVKYINEIEGYPISSPDNQKLLYASLKNNIINNAFSKCVNLKIVNLSNSVKAIGASAFYQCSNLTEINMDNVTSIGSSAFYSCTNISKIYIPNCSYIGSYAFQYTAISKINFSDVNITGNMNYAFASCSSLTQADINLSATYIPTGIFMNCRKLVSLSISNNSPTSVGASAFYYCNTLKNGDINNLLTTVKSVGNAGFYACYSLTNITSPSLYSIGTSAFAYCSSLQNVQLTSNTNIYIYTSAFYNCRSLNTFIASRIYSIGSSAFYNCSSLTAINTNNNLSYLIYLGSGAFYNCNKLQSFSASLLKSIYSYGFASCSNLSLVSLRSCSYIYGSAFVNCWRLVSLYLMSTKVVNLNGGSNTFLNTPFRGYSMYTTSTPHIYVPSSLYATYIKSTHWSYFSTYFVSV